ncbi:AfsA-related hotdog domain-containing protein [Spirochaeta isovalerica]|uniref:A-factor biosynthesis hotdog domain-containing protein n=1 Tax=Spirochaeta isovalerica TaxID=150 RepID=A0A841R9K8_9SPIO|nr:AfsA-related hotdog domain-containing protein [Spirochaeta isovalerica]MBB6479907.1 hypothetical protein [Spirochaeta isovalerica]
MLASESIAICKSLVHKEKEENVLINNLRAEIPPCLSGKVFEDEILPRLNREEQIFMRQRFSLLDQFSTEKIFPDTTGRVYLLAQILPVLPEQYVREMRNKLSSESWKFLNGHYADDGRNGLILKGMPDEMDQIKILKILDEKSRIILDSEKALLSEILFRSGVADDRNSFYANMVVDTEHEFYFEHYNEHVPGMMVIEAARQFGLATCHKYGMIPESEYQIMMSDLDIHFEKYVDYHLPIKLVGTVDVKKRAASGMWKKVILNFQIIQNQTLAVSIRFNGRSIEKALFGELRQEELYNKIGDFRYKPHTNSPGRHKFCLRNLENYEYIDGALKEISTRDFKIEIPGNDRYDPEKKHDFLFSFDNRYFINGSCYQTNIERSGNSLIVDFSFSDLSEEDFDNLVQCLKLYTKAIECRDFS